jgi:hypothetical protein
MKRTAEIIPGPSHPSLVDYLLLLSGVGLSLYLQRLSPMAAEAQDTSGPPPLQMIISFLPDLMRLPEGILLLWPIFYTMQRLLGRTQGVTSAEWLWVLSWVGVSVLTGLAAWEWSGTLPEFIQPHVNKPRLLWYVIFVPTMAGLGVVLTLVGLLRRGPIPWSHTLGLALIIWPAPALAGILMFGKFI